MPAGYDEIGPWSEVKLDILREYASPYSRILTAYRFHHLYIDAFAAGGTHLSRTTGEVVPGSPLVALGTDPPFNEYHFIDANPTRVQQLRSYCTGRGDVHIHEGDCNRVLTEAVFPRVKFQERRRALCLLDPYNIDLSWEVVAAAGRMKTIEIFVTFMVMDMNMNVLLRDPSKAVPSQIARMDRFWGDRSWREVAYEVSPQGRLFGDPDEIKVEDANNKLAEAYRDRLTDVADFGYAPKPLLLRNSLGATIYYLFFASPNRTGHKIVEQIFDKHRKPKGG